MGAKGSSMKQEESRSNAVPPTMEWFPSDIQQKDEGQHGFFGFLRCCHGNRKEPNNSKVGARSNIKDEDICAAAGGTRRFTYAELAHATKNFECKLGEGGFGSVYKGQLPVAGGGKSLGGLVAIKRLSSSSKQGSKEFLQEVNIINQLRHRNLVKLIGWCRTAEELLLVYEYMPNGSLDMHLFGSVADAEPLPWTTRYKIALGLASALFYLHEEWEQCILHRDVKSSNVMLDCNFNAKLGDFGLARLIEHDNIASYATVPAGTIGYLAPECCTSGLTSKESDVYSFGVVALEIACGRRPMFEPAPKQRKVYLSKWVWGLYGQGAILDAADTKLRECCCLSDEDLRQMERLMVVGLWCAHPNKTKRPSLRKVISALNFDIQVPELPPVMPELAYDSPALDGSCYNSLITSSTTPQTTMSLSISATTTTFTSTGSRPPFSDEIERAIASPRLI